MARPQSKGLPYFPMDVDFLSDIKIRKIMKACGVSSVTVLLCLLGNIYGDEGYYMAWDEDVAFLTADSLGVNEGLVSETLKKALQVDFFDLDLFKKYNIITSKGIQNRFFAATEKRKNDHVISEYILVSNSETKVIVSETQIKVSPSTQSKVKESKVKESKETIPELRILELKKHYPAEWVDEAVRICVSKTKGVSYLEGILKNMKAEGGIKSQASVKRTKFHNFKGETSSMADNDINDKVKQLMDKRGVT